MISPVGTSEINNRSGDVFFKKILFLFGGVFFNVDF